MSLKTANNGRWIRKYKYFFIIGVVILSFQVFLAARFLQLNKAINQEDEWQPQSEQVKTIQSNIKQKRPANATILRIEELDFKLDCEINGKEAISAIHRAKSQRCKKLIADTVCRSLNGTLYPKQLIGNCPNDGKEPRKALGCFKDDNSFRLLNGYFGVNKKDNSPAFCIQLCLQSGFPYAGVQYSNECFCGNDEPPSTTKLPDSSCNMKCPANNHATCGGYYTLNVYQTGIKRFVPQTAVLDLNNQNDNPVRIVFLLTLNGRALRQVRRLIKILYHKDHFYYIHVDVREDYLFRELLPLEKQFPNIRLTRQRFATIWGGASLLEMLLNCMKELLKMSDWHYWDYVLNLSESDYPVKMVSSLQHFLTANKGSNFVKSHGRDTQRFLQKQGLDKTFVECDYRMWRVANRQLPSGIQMDGGSDWVALSRPFITYVTSESDHLILGLRVIFKYTLLPAESFFHTVLRNSKFCDSYIDNNLHVTNWKRKFGCKCQYKHIVDWCGCSPNDFRPEDWARIQTTASRQLYFARKFEPIINQEIVLKLELWLHNLKKPSKFVPNLYGYWQSLYHYLDLSSVNNDGLLTVSYAAIRHWMKTNNCNMTTRKLQQITSYHYKDFYKFTLVHFEVGKGQFEIGFKPLKSLILNTPNLLVKQLEDLYVSSDYDQKEQISRNFAGILTPYTEPVLIYKFMLNKQINLTCLWISPIGELMEVNDFSVDENNLVGYVKSNLKQPNLPGVWLVKLIYNELILAEVKFVVFPLEFFSGKEVTNKQASLIHGGLFINNKINKLKYSKFLINDFDRNILKHTSILNSKRYGSDLIEWIDSLFRRFYVVEKMCAVNKQIEFCNVYIGHCLETNWSSFAPDPKSTIDRTNQNGTFSIW